MSGLNQIPSDYKKFMDQTLYQYLPKVNKVRTLYNTIYTDAAQPSYEYVKRTQSYTAAKGWYEFSDPEVLADGASPSLDALGTMDAISTTTTYGKAFRVDRKLLNSNSELVKRYIADHSVEMVNIMENMINRKLIANMASNAGQVYTASGNRWSNGGDPVADLANMKVQFQQQSGGIEPDFLILNNSEYSALIKEQRFQSLLFTSAKPLETGKITPNPLGIDNVIVDAAMPSGYAIMGKKGMFGDLIISENYKTYEVSEGAAGVRYEAIFTFADQYKLPHYLLYASGI